MPLILERRRYLVWLLNNFENKIKINEITGKERTNLLISWIFDSWNKIDINCIKNSFRFCGYTEDLATVPKWKKYYCVNE